ncbi:hypothetical protein EEJ31_05290 [Cryobacterium tepidiphilum]|uniref:AbiEi antitoxin C-terminal domain-containing protein n=2 Tax=Cryobacterium tepidiphilum TaxID=2486026 RepID=A0A3M8LGX7_9MICO|nr:hypothetical protein EEJ31_05290 [Cryobacterium tepidiphilum]
MERGNVIRLRRGAYVAAAEWQLLSPGARRLLAVRAHAAAADEQPVFSHFSAAAVWGLPSFNTWPTNIHVATEAALGGRSSSGVSRHPQQAPLDVVQRDGVLVASVAATAVALARVLPFAEAVAVLDAAMHVPRVGQPLTARPQLEGELARLGRRPGCAAARRAVEFATHLAGSPGESVSRANMFLLGFQLPELQVPFFDARGLIGYVDFFWRSINRIGEFDGFGKYVREEFTQGRTTAQVMMDEKEREDRLRACGPMVCRWGWSTAIALPILGGFLARNGVPRAA